MSLRSSRHEAVRLNAPPPVAAQGRVTVLPTPTPTPAPAPAQAGQRSSGTTGAPAGTETGFSRQEQLDQVIFQLLSTYGCITDPDLNDLLQPILAELRIPAASFDIRAAFERLNKKVKPALGLEVRSLIRQHALQSTPDAPNPTAIHYHALVNTEADYVSREFGSDFKPPELHFFTELATKLLLQAGSKFTTSIDFDLFLLVYFYNNYSIAFVFIRAYLHMYISMM